MKQKLPKGVFFLEDPVYCQEFMIVFASTHAKFRKIVRYVLNYELEKDDTCTGQFTGMENSKYGALGVIWSSDKHTNLVHEIFHATAWTMRNRDIHLDSEASEEAWAYYISFLYREIQERRNK